MDMSGQPAELHMRTDANNLVTTASTTHLPEQKETIHMINQLRHESCSGAIDDLAHVISEDCLADCLTKASAKPQALMKAVETGELPNVDKHPPFRELMQNRHKAYMAEMSDISDSEDDRLYEPNPLVSWIVFNLDRANDIITFLAEPVRLGIEQYLASDRLYDDWWGS